MKVEVAYLLKFDLDICPGPLLPSLLAKVSLVSRRGEETPSLTGRNGKECATVFNMP